MKPVMIIPTLLLALPLTGCGIQGLAKQAADATACKAISPTIKAINSSYETGIVDAGLITKIDNLIGDQARSLLSQGLSKDLKSLTTALKNGNSTANGQQDISALTKSISKRCADALVNPLGG